MANYDGVNLGFQLPCRFARTDFHHHQRNRRSFGALRLRGGIHTEPCTGGTDGILLEQRSDSASCKRNWGEACKDGDREQLRRAKYEGEGC